MYILKIRDNPMDIPLTQLIYENKTEFKDIGPINILCTNILSLPRDRPGY